MHISSLQYVTNSSLDVDTGENIIFTNIQAALLVCGFGDRAEKWDWHIVVLRRGRQFLTLYMLVVHAPYPGLWIIAEHLSVGETVGACTMHSIMVGQDVAPAASVTYENFIIKRGLWAEAKMQALLGFSEKSNALQMCLTTDVEDLELIATFTIDCQNLTPGLALSQQQF